MRIAINGCFDCFHAGHKYLIAKALTWSRYGELLVLINSDSSVQKLKGPNRPIDTLQIRRKNIKTFRKYSYPNHNVMHMIEFDTEEQLESLINSFKPDLILKGNDRPDVREIVGSLNWPVCIVPRIKDKEGNNISTTGGILK